MSFGLRAGGSADPHPETDSHTNHQVVDGIDASTPWVAAADGNLGLLQSSLAQLGLPPTASDEHGYTLLHAAASYGRMDVLRWLLAQETTANKDAADREGDTALHYASTSEVAQFLVEACGIDPTLRNHAGRTALQHKQAELAELMADEEMDDDDDDDDDVSNLRGVIAYLLNLSTMPQ